MRWLSGGRNFPFGSATASVDAQGNPLPGLTIQTYNIATRDPRAMGFDPQVQAIIGLTPLPNRFDVGDGLNTAGFRSLAVRTDPQRDFNVRIDHTLNSSNHLYGRYSWGQQDTVGDTTNSGAARFPDLPPIVATFRSPRNLAIGWRSSLNNATVNELVVGGNRFIFDFAIPTNQDPRTTPIITQLITDQAEIFSNGFLQAFITAKAGGESSLLNQLTALHPNRTSSESGAAFLRRFFASTLANNNVGSLAATLNGVTVTQGGVTRNLPDAAGLGRFFFIPYPQFNAGGMQIIDSNSFSNYHGGVFQLSRRFEQGLELNLAYTCSNGLVSRLIGGWTVTTALTWQSGVPFTVVSGTNTVSNRNSSRANYSGTNFNPSYADDPTLGVPFLFTGAERAQFSLPGPGELGNTSRNQFRFPAQFNMDASIIKRIAITEQKNIEFRAQMFNVTNTPYMGFPSSGLTVLSGSTFSRDLTSDSFARVIEFAFKFNF